MYSEEETKLELTELQELRCLAVPGGARLFKGDSHAGLQGRHPAPVLEWAEEEEMAAT